MLCNPSTSKLQEQNLISNLEVHNYVHEPDNLVCSYIICGYYGNMGNNTEYKSHTMDRHTNTSTHITKYYTYLYPGQTWHHFINSIYIDNLFMMLYMLNILPATRYICNNNAVTWSVGYHIQQSDTHTQYSLLNYYIYYICGVNILWFCKNNICTFCSWLQDEVLLWPLLSTVKNVHVLGHMFPWNQINQ